MKAPQHITKRYERLVLDAFALQRDERPGCDRPCNGFAISQGVCRCMTNAIRQTDERLQREH